MKKINDSSYQKIKEFKKYKDLFDFSSLECRVALLSMLILDVIFFISSKMSGIDIIVSNCISYFDNIGIAMIGFLGFIVTGLAILTGAISSKVVKRLQSRHKAQALEKILLSFYLLGLSSSVIVVLSFIFHFMRDIPIKSILQLNIILLSITSYLVVFSIFYAVKLIGNCLELFYIVSDMQIIEENKYDNKIALKSKYNSYRITALEKTIFTNNVKNVVEYSKVINELIKSDIISQQEKEIYLDMYRKHFNL